MKRIRESCERTQIKLNKRNKKNILIMKYNKQQQQQQQPEDNACFEHAGSEVIKRICRKRMQKMEAKRQTNSLAQFSTVIDGFGFLFTLTVTRE